MKLGLTANAIETLLWLAQGKTNPDFAAILGDTESPAKSMCRKYFKNLGSKPGVPPPFGCWRCLVFHPGALSRRGSESTKFPRVYCVNIADFIRNSTIISHYSAIPFLTRLVSVFVSV